METGELIVYTSADPVLQIAAHEEVIPLEELYRICEYARSITLERPPCSVASLPALMWENRVALAAKTVRDYAVSPFEDTVINS